MIVTSITTLVQIYKRIFQYKNCENRLILDKVMTMSLVCSFFGPPCSVLCCPTTVVIDCCGGCILQIYYWSFGGMFLVTSSQWTEQCQYQRYWTGITILELQLNVLTDEWLFPADLVSVCPFHFQCVLSSDLLLFFRPTLLPIMLIMTSLLPLNSRLSSHPSSLSEYR